MPKAEVVRRGEAPVVHFVDSNQGEGFKPVMNQDYTVALQLGFSRIVLNHTTAPHSRVGFILIPKKDFPTSKVFSYLNKGMAMFGTVRYTKSNYDPFQYKDRYSGIVNWYIPSSSAVQPTSPKPEDIASTEDDEAKQEEAEESDYSSGGGGMGEEVPGTTYSCPGDREKEQSPCDVPYIDSQIFSRATPYPDGQTEYLDENMRLQLPDDSRKTLQSSLPLREVLATGGRRISPQSSPPPRRVSANPELQDKGKDTDYGLDEWSEVGLPSHTPGNT